MLRTDGRLVQLWFQPHDQRLDAKNGEVQRIG